MTRSVATRESALARLQSFVPRSGRQYTEKRNYDLGPESRENVSRLSSYLSHRLLTEREVVESVLKEHKAQAVESFVQEVLWRTYWKGWLEGRPQVYSAWIRLLLEDGQRWPEREDFKLAVAGQTGIEPFDSWVQELKTHGYLHNHARMWFASIWIFTLKLPWSLGAAFFMEHLLDGDVASNTLSWRWVAGLQTKGKHYVATAKNIAKYTDGRFQPQNKLVESPAPLSGPATPKYIPPIDFPFKISEKAGEDYAVLLTPDDLSPEVGATSELSPKLVLTIGLQEAEREWAPSPSVSNFEEDAVNDAVSRAEEHYDCPSISLAFGDDPAGSLAEVMQEHQLSSLVYYEPFIGPWKAPVAKLSSRDVGVKFFPLRRTWDGILFPRAVKGYFHFKKQVYPQVLRSKGRL